MHRNEISAAIERLNQAISTEGPARVRTTIIGKDDGFPPDCCITANRAGFLELGYRFLRVAEGTERATEKMNNLLSSDSEWLFGSLERLEDQAMETLTPKPVEEPQKKSVLYRLAIGLILVLFLYGLLTYLAPR
jgi:hypothetical protein